MRTCATLQCAGILVRIKAVRERTCDLIVPALYDDNYIALCLASAVRFTCG